jgi:hypothetical protein
MPSFGKRAKRATPARRETFDFTFLRDEVPETHSFLARARADMISLSTTLVAAKNDPESAIPQIVRLINKMLDNKDGTPLNWKPVALPVEPKARPAEVDEFTPGAVRALADQYSGGTLGGTPVDSEDDEDAPRVFRGPDGELYQFEHAEKFEAFEAGSSRRRWHQLMEIDDDIEVEAPDLMELFEWLVGLAAGRPTQPSS